MSSQSNSYGPDDSQDPRFEQPFSLSSSMRTWRSRLPGGRSSTSQNSNTDPSHLEAGLTYRNISSTPLSEASEDGDAGLGSLTHNEKSDANPQASDAPLESTSSDQPNETQLEKVPTADDTNGRSQRKWSVSVPGFLKRSRTGAQADPTSNDAEQANEKEKDTSLKKSTSSAQPPPEYTEEARHVVESFNAPAADYETKPRSGTETPSVDRHLYDSDYVPAPDKYKPSIFGAILTSKLHDIQESSQQQQETQKQEQYQSAQAQPKYADYLDLARRSAPSKPKHQRFFSQELPSLPSSGTATPSKKPKWYEQPEHASSLANMLVQAGISSTGPAVPGTSSAVPRGSPPHKHVGMIATAVEMLQNGGRRKSGDRQKSRYDVVAEVADIIARRRYLIKLCGAFMAYGAPTHRIEEYLAASARALLIDAQFMYIPGAMMCTFIDSTIQSNSVELVRIREGLDFGRLKDTFNVYKLVIHEKYTAEEGIAEIENIRKRPDPYGIWFRIFVFGMASVIVGPFSFSSRPIDFAPIFVMGFALGFLQLKVVPRSEQFSNVFEVFACVLSAFIARGLGSIKWHDGSDVFCFSAVAQSSIAMILPGFMVLNSALELQGRSIVAGSVRMVYAIIYVLFLGFGLLVGTTVFGLIKRDATTVVTCSIPSWWSPAGENWRLIYTRFIWAPMFACCVGLIYRAKWRQLPVMALIAACGHQANFWISTQLSSNLQVANAVGAFVIGCLANLYSRLFHGLAAAAMLPAIYCQVPGGLASSGSLVAGINSSNQIFGNSSSVSVINNGTQGFVAAQDDPSSVYGGTIFNVGYGMVQVAIGISVGLYLSALAVYPYGKRNSGLFSF